MGNHLGGVAPAQIFPVEHYLSDGAIKDLEFVKNLGSTRFFKVALTRHVQSGALMVVKIFTLQDVSLQLRADRDKILEIKRTLEGALNCLPFQKAFATERAGFVIRQYMKHSVYDRLSTRPFLSTMEKKWVAFQLLLALQQIHKHGIRHGDIKLENVMITSWNWVFLTDFASFKPTYLPEDNPADFSYFFDTSRRRTCYIAPERFKTSNANASETNTDYLPNTQNRSMIESGELIPSMDIFSAGCCLIELFTESSPFTFSNLLAYRAGEYYPDKALEKIEDPDLRELVEHMIQKEPAKRLSANDYLSQQKGKSFPQFFYSFLLYYMQMFCTDSTMMPDTKISRLMENIDAILDMLKSEADFDGHGLTLVASLVTSNIRSLKFCESRLQALLILSKMSKHVPNDVLLDRILPYVIHLLSDRFPAVRIGALQCLSDCLIEVTKVPLQDANIFPEYILPSILPLCQDKSELVRASFARLIAPLALESVRFLDLTLKSGQSRSHEQAMSTYDHELVSLQNSFQDAVSVLLADSANSVKQTLMEHSVKKLAVFFWKVKANDVLLSHMITFLNDKEDPYLRDSFYRSLSGVVSRVGWQCSQILQPLLQQGLSDSEEFVIVQCIRAMTELTSDGLLEKVSLHTLLKETAPFLIHPNLWIRQATCGFISAAANQMTEVDVVVKLGRILEPFVKQEVVQVENPEIVFSKLHDHLPRNLFESVLKCRDIGGLLSILEGRQAKRSVSGYLIGSSGSNPGNSSLHTEVPAQMQQLIRRLQTDGMSSEVEDKVLVLKEQMVKLSRNRANTKPKRFDGSIELDGLVLSSRLEIKTESLNIDPRANMIRPIPEHQHVPSVNEEWQHMFGPESHGSTEPGVEAQSMPIASSLPRSNSPKVDTPRRSRTPQPHLDHRPPASKWAPGLGQDSGHFPRCKASLDNLVRTKRGEYALNARKRTQLGYDDEVNKFVPPYDWRLQGTLFTHLHEHKDGVVQLTRVPDKPMFASASLDGTVRLWDISNFESSSIVDQSRKQYSNHNHSALTSLDISGSGELLATSAENGSIYIQSLETGTVLHGKTLDTQQDGPAIKIHFQETGTSPILAFGTAFGGIEGLDLRQPGRAFRMDNAIQDGLQTAFTISQDQFWSVSGTSAGKLICWDLRFQLPVVEHTHPAETRIRDLCIQPRSSSIVLVAVQGNNEVGFWNMESQFRQMTLWASPSPVLSTNQSSANSVTAIQPIFTHQSKYILTAGTDARVRLWNLRRPQDSYIAIPAGGETIHPNHVTYQTSLVDGTEIIQEMNSRPKSNASANSTSVVNDGSGGMSGGGGSVQDSANRRPGLERAAIGHHNWISSMALCNSKHWYVVTGSRDGVIKVWL